MRREFFYGWQRKVGCIALVMALAIFGSFLRAQFVCDDFLIGPGRGTVIRSIQVRNTGIKWQVCQTRSSAVFQPGWISYERSGGRDSFERIVLQREFEWRRQFCGFDSGCVRNVGQDGDVLKFWMFSHWILIAPLTVLSAYLLLIPLRDRTSTTSRGDT